MSALANFLQNELLTLSSEARRKHPEIKEAAERLLYILRALKERPQSQPVPEGVDIVAVELAKTDEALRPFIMSCETKNAKLVPTAVGCLQRLITHQAIPEASIMLVLKTLSDLITTSVELQLKILQTVLPLLTNYRNVHGEILAEALFLCFRLQETKSPIVNNTAAATVRQLVTFVFDKVATEDERANVETGTTDFKAVRHLSLSGQDACMLFKDLCLLTGGEPASFLPLQSLPKYFGLELIEAVICHHPKLFQDHAELCNLMKERVCPLIIKSFSDRLDFPLACRLMRVVHAILKQYHEMLMMECEIFLSMFCRLLEPDHAPLWHRVLIMEVYKSLCADAGLLRFVYKSYDQKEHTTKVFHEMITAIRRIVVSERPALLLHSPVTNSSEAVDMEAEEQYSLTASGAQMKLQCLDQLDKAEPPSIPETYIIYLAILCMSSIVDSEAQFAMPLLAEASTPSEHKNDVILAIEMANASWAGILAAVSFLVTASVDDEIFSMVIRAYQNITSVLGLLGLTSPRDAFLASLSKSCIPSFLAGDAFGHTKGDAGQGLHPASLQNLARGGVVLNDRNVLCLRALIYVAHSLSPVLEDKAWYLILETLQVADKYIATGKTGRREQSSMALLGDAKENRLRSGSIIGPAQHGSAMENQFVTLLLFTKKLFESTSAMEERNLMEFLRALCQLARTSIVNTSTTAGPTAKDASMKVAEEKSFAVAKIHDVVLHNTARLVQASNFTLWDLVIGELVDLAHIPTCTSSMRAQVCQTLSDILVAAIQTANLKDTDIEMKLLEPIRRLTLVESNASGTTVDSEEKDRIARYPWFVDVQKAGLETLNKIMQNSGQYISNGWPLILEVVRTVVSLRVRKPRMADGQAPTAGNTQDAILSPPLADTAATTAKAAGLVRVAFPCLQLICTDFLSVLNPTVLHQCIETLGSFGSQMDDLNISLTAVGLLWSVSDFVLTKRQDLEKEHLANKQPPNQDPKTSASHSSVMMAESSLLANMSMKRSASTCIAMLTEPLSTRTMDSLWMLLLGHLSQLCSDSRPEVRNSANQTLFRTISMNGAKLTLEAWEQCIWGVLFPLLERVQLSSEIDASGRLNSPDVGTPTVTMHHSRSTPSKQWDETKVITLSGISKCLLDFLPVLVELGDGFDRAWALFLDYIKSWCLGGSPEVSMAAVKSLKSLVQYPKTLAEGEIPRNVQMRLENLMRVAWDVWEGIGTGIIAGSDENLAASAEDADRVAVGTAWGQPGMRILHGFFTQDTMTAYVALFPDIYEVIKSTFGLFELRQLLNVLSHLLLYHSNPPPGATASRIRADFISDLEQPTPLQSSVLDLVAGGKLDIDAIQGSVEVVLTTVSGFVKLPFVQRGDGSASVRNSSVQRPTLGAAEKEKGFTYIALSKKSMQALVELFERYAKLRSVYSGPFEAIIEALGVPMKAKYDCPSPGTKDTTPLWKSAANTCMTISRIGLEALNEFVEELPQEVSNSIYTKLLNTFEGILLPSSEPPAELSAEELSADEDFDISVLTTIESDVFPHLGRPNTSEAILRRLVEIIGSGAKLYTTQLEAVGHNTLEDATTGEESNATRGVEDVQLQAANGVVIGAPRIDALVKPRGPLTASDVAGPQAFPLGSDVVPATRERFAVSCMETLFGLCSDAKNDTVQVRTRIAEVVGPVMLEKCKFVIRSYATDRPLYGQLPLPRVRNDEIALVMRRLQSLNMRPGVLVRHLGEDKMRTYLTRTGYDIFCSASVIKYLTLVE
ncbi:hypothetical protein SpCBS45565_g04327 [Spizellomyces sp. 'palustris']|nr:hypothetical protein SpCBS45565_g04327 [Spizellomyces sp. 'palustris']